MTISTTQINVRDKAAARIPQFAHESGGDDNTLLRLRVTSHDELSFCYTMRFDKAASDSDDVVFVSNGLSIVVDKLSAPLLDGTEIAYFDGSARLEQGSNSRKPNLDRELGILGTISVHALSPDQLWEAQLGNESDAAQHPNADRADTRMTVPPLATSEPTIVERADPVRAVPTNVALSPLAAESQQLLDSETGLKCLPRFWKAKLWRMIRREPDELLRRYTEEHLAFLKKHVEPLTDNLDPNADAEFSALCREMAAAPNLPYVAARFGCEEPEEEDPILWLKWAGANEPEPTKCLYSVACFVAVPPFAGDPPAIVGATISALSSLSLLRLGHPALAADVVELFFGITEDDFSSADSLVTTLRRSPLNELGQPHTTTLRSTLLESLRAIGRDSQQTLLARAFAEC